MLMEEVLEAVKLKTVWLKIDNFTMLLYSKMHSWAKNRNLDLNFKVRKH